jgi:hypothetical protein
VRGGAIACHAAAIGFALNIVVALNNNEVSFISDIIHAPRDRIKVALVALLTSLVLCVVIACILGSPAEADASADQYMIGYDQLHSSICTSNSSTSNLESDTEHSHKLLLAIIAAKCSALNEVSVIGLMAASIAQFLTLYIKQNTFALCSRMVVLRA